MYFKYIIFLKYFIYELKLHPDLIIYLLIKLKIYTYI